MGTYYTNYTLLDGFSGPANVISDLKSALGNPATYGYGTKIFLTDVAENISMIDAAELVPYTYTPVPMNTQLQAAVAMCTARAAAVGVLPGMMPLTALYTLEEYNNGSTRFTAASLVAVAANLELYLATIDTDQDLVGNQYAVVVNQTNTADTRVTEQNPIQSVYSPGWEAWDGFSPPLAEIQTASGDLTQQPDNGYYTAQVYFTQAVAQACRLASIGRLASVVTLLNLAGQEYNNEQVRRTQPKFSILNVVSINGRLPQYGTVPSFLPDLSTIYAAGFAAFDALVTTYGGSLISRVFSFPITNPSGVTINVGTYADVARLPGPVTINVSGTLPVTYVSGCTMLIGVGTGGAAGGGNIYDLNANGFMDGPDLIALLNDALKAALAAQVPVGTAQAAATFSQLQGYVAAQGFKPSNMADLAASIQGTL